MEETMDANSTEMEEGSEEKKQTRIKAAGVPILSPSQLPDHCNLPANLPTRGKKEVTPNGSHNQQQKLQRIYHQQDKLLKEERVVKVNRVAVGEWNQSKQLVEVKVEKGKFWQTMGYNSNGKKYLYPEEGLFLLEMNIMELRHGKVPISVQKAYELMIPYQFSLEHYQVYCHLMRMGYITTRHKECDVSDYEYRINLDQFRHRQKQAYKKVQGWFQQMNENADGAQQYGISSESDSGRDVKSNKSSGSMSFHGSGVSGKAVVEVELRSSSSGEKGQQLPGSGVSTDSSADNDDSSAYSDDPIEPKKESNMGSEVPSINLLEFHKKYVSDACTSVVSSTEKKKCDVSDYEYRINLDQFRHRQKQAYKKVQGWFQQMNENADGAQQYGISSESDSGRDVKSNKSSGSMSFHGSGVSGKAVVEVELRSSSSGEKGQQLPGSGVSTDSSADNDDSSAYSDDPIEPKKESNMGSEVPSINLLEFHKKYVSDACTSVVSSTEKKKLILESMDEKQKLEVEKTPAPAAEMVQKQSRKRKLKELSNQETSTDNQIENKPKKIVAIEIEGERVEKTTVTQIEETQKSPVESEHICSREPIMKKPSPLKKGGINTSRDDSGKDSESRRSSDGSAKDFPMKPKEASITEDVVMESTSDHSQGQDKQGQDKSMKAKSSDLGTDLSPSPSSIDVDIDDVLGLLSPSSLRNDSMLEDGKANCKYSQWNFQQLQLPNLAQQSQGNIMPLPEYLPESIAHVVVVEEKEEIKEEEEKEVEKKEEEGQKEESAAQVAKTDILQELVKVNQLLKTSTELMESTTMMLNMENQEASQEQKPKVTSITSENMDNVRRLFPAKPAAANWGEYKRLNTNVDQLEGLTEVIQSPVTHLWQGEVQPLVRPSDAVSTSYVLHKLQIIQNANLTSQHVRWPYPSSVSEDCRIAFDVYQPDTGYKKCKPGQPGFHVVVSSVKDPVPDLATQAYLLRQAKPVKLIWAVVDSNGDISFYSLQDAELPMDITNGW